MTTTKKPATKRSAKPKTAAKTTAKKTTKPVITGPITINFDDPKVIAKINAYNALKGADLAIPEELSLEVEAIVAAARKEEEDRLVTQAEQAIEHQQDIEKANQEGPKYIRNGYPSEQFIRLERQEDNGKRIKLSARGQRGDLFPLQDGDVDDPAIQDGLRRGLIELIGNGDAQEIIRRQTSNIQTQHVPLNTLRNSQGESYENESIKVEAEFNKQGVVVAVNNPEIDAQQSNVKWTGKKTADGGLIRSNQVAQFVPTGGNPAILSSGFNNDAAQRSDAVARQKGSEGPEAGLAGLTLTVEPTQKN